MAESVDGSAYVMRNFRRSREEEEIPRGTLAVVIPDRSRAMIAYVLEKWS